ncbi:MAG TPA: hypothetical protein VM557_03110 [Thermoanaerobaculia bacterium]|nr:hypothetical protein [Thermoanaerobaculia bacterium]
MTIYGEFDSQFRARPAAWRMLLVAFGTLLIAAFSVSVLLAAVIAAAGRAHRPESAAVAFQAPPLPSFGLLFEAGIATVPSLHLIIAAIAVALALVMAFIWPISPRLSSQVAISIRAQALLAFGVIAPVLAFVMIRRQLIDGPAELIEEIVAVVAAAVAIIAVERRHVALLAEILPLDSPLHRLKWWMVRLAIPFAIVGGLAWLTGHLAIAAGAAAVLGLTLIETLSRAPRSRFLEWKDVAMKEAAATIPLIAVVIVAAAVWAFGFSPLVREKTLLWRGSMLRFAAPDEARREAGLEPPLPRESVIRIEWAN